MPESMPMIDPEFPPGNDMSPLAAILREDAVLDRRELLQLLGASMALASMSGCNEPPTGKILPYVAQPPELTPGRLVEYASAMVLDGFATGLLVQSREGRPIKIEGNPEHPASLGATGVFEQAAVLSLYDPDRARSPLDRGLPQSWLTFFEAMTRTEGLRGLRFMLPPQSSPLLAALIERIQQRHPGAGFTFHSPIDRRPVYEAARRLFGRPLEAQYDFRRADVVLSFDADFLSSMPNSVRWARDFAARRRPATPMDEMSRLYVVETSFSPTGSIADHRLAVRPSLVVHVAARVLAALVAQGLRPPDMPDALARALGPAAGSPHAAPHTGQHAGWIAAVARDLAQSRGQSVVLAGPHQPAEVHVLAHLINVVLGNVGRTVTLTEPALLQPLGPDISELVSDMRAGRVETLIMLETNPVYTAPADLDFAGALRQVPRTVHHGLYHDETSAHCHWFLPATHFLESWGDARAYDGTLTFVQPLLRPLYGSRSMVEILAAFAGRFDIDGHTLLQSFWLPRLPAAPSSSWHWEQSLQRGFLDGSQHAPVPLASLVINWSEAALALDRVARAAAPAAPAAVTASPRTLELAFEPSPTVYDGRFANNGWLLELPQPLTKLTWDNAALVSPAMAARLGAHSGDVVELTSGGRSLRAPVLVLPGHADEAVTLHLGWGRQSSETLARDRGVDVYRLRTSATLAFARDLAVTPTGATHPLAITQDHWRLHGRDLALHTTISHYRSHPDFAAMHKAAQPSLLPVQERTGLQWAMTIDTAICTGCSACVIACQAENNVPIVGKNGVARSREMHWLRIDQYFVGSAESLEVIHQPMLCQHCEQAPCEYVCPVYATSHSPDGLNEMTYNRCIGTRFCSNNCPYKVRRFNWFEYQEDRSSRRLQHNPDVTVRERGVMEKCTYCVQRIRRAEMDARMQDRPLAPGAVVTACQQACPTGAIQFASLDDVNSETVRRRREPRSYFALHELGTRPRTMYLAKINNPNPELG
jgi:Fe-S-cluster-containing dehydrogenase component/anaerobic selenocysteine-containing dehydrogenase